jgi:hypothetical protein
MPQFEIQESLPCSGFRFENVDLLELEDIPGVLEVVVDSH